MAREPLLPFCIAQASAILGMRSARASLELHFTPQQPTRALRPQQKEKGTRRRTLARLSERIVERRPKTRTADDVTKRTTTHRRSRTDAVSLSLDRHASSKMLVITRQHSRSLYFIVYETLRTKYLVHQFRLRTRYLVHQFRFFRVVSTLRNRF